MSTFCSLCDRQVSTAERKCCEMCAETSFIQSSTTKGWILSIFMFFVVFVMLAKGMELYQSHKQQKNDVMIYIKSIAGQSN